MYLLIISTHFLQDWDVHPDVAPKGSTTTLAKILGIPDHASGMLKNYLKKKFIRQIQEVFWSGNGGPKGADAGGGCRIFA